MKKIAILVAVFAIALTANMAFAYTTSPCGGNCPGGNDWGKKDDCPCPSIDVKSSNDLNIDNIVTGLSKTGKNSLNMGSIVSGDATVWSSINNTLGYNETYINPASDKVSVKVDSKNKLDLNNIVNGGSYTGLNTANGMMIMTKSRCSGRTNPMPASSIVSGAAKVGSEIFNFAGSNVTKIGCTDCGTAN
jgi:hypothetical protein